MATDTSARGHERLIRTAQAGHSCELTPEPRGNVPMATLAGVADAGAATTAIVVALMLVSWPRYLKRRRRKYGLFAGGGEILR